MSAHSPYTLARMADGSSPDATPPERAWRETRGAYIEGLRDLADLLESHPDCPLPYQGLRSSETSACPLYVYVHSDAQLTAAVDALGGYRVPDERCGFRYVREIEGLVVEVVPIHELTVRA